MFQIILKHTVHAINIRNGHPLKTKEMIIVSYSNTTQDAKLPLNAV